MRDPEEMNKFLTKLVSFIGMNVIPDSITKQKNPNSFIYSPIDKNDLDHGVTGYVILVESHACAHSWQNQDFLNVAITSCKKYDPQITTLWIAGYTKSKIFKFESISF
jgi:S-adenosylmethionine/arginine decarboxylase-like enzyme